MQNLVYRNNTENKKTVIKGLLLFETINLENHNNK